MGRFYHNQTEVSTFLANRVRLDFRAQLSYKVDS